MTKQTPKAQQADTDATPAEVPEHTTGPQQWLDRWHADRLGRPIHRPVPEPVEQGGVVSGADLFEWGIDDDERRRQ